MQIFNGRIEFDSKEDFENFLKKMNKDDAITILETAIDYMNKSGLTGMNENYALYESFKKLKENEG